MNRTNSVEANDVAVIEVSAIAQDIWNVESHVPETVFGLLTGICENEESVNVISPVKVPEPCVPESVPVHVPSPM